jgi:hypothetical protein
MHEVPPPVAAPRTTATRAEFLRAAALAGAGTLAATAVLEAWPEHAVSAPSPALDRRILRFMLQLERLQADFYAAALRHDGLGGALRAYAQTVAAHERAHVAFLERALGPEAPARPRPRSDRAPEDPGRFVAAAIALEDAAVAAYNGQAANLTRAALAGALEIVSVEGRHAAWIRDLGGRRPAPRAQDPGRDAARVTAALRAAGVL